MLRRKALGGAPSKWPTAKDLEQGRTRENARSLSCVFIFYLTCWPYTLAHVTFLCAQITREVLDIAAAHVKPGITTDEIDEIVHQATIERNAYPSPLGYRGFPKSVCT
jgi:hypothetical protein